jgi:phage tail protein X
MSTALQLPDVPAKETALQVYSANKGLDPYLQKVRAEIDAFLPDISTRKGREAIASIAYKVARSKTALDNVGKDLVAELKEVPKKIDAERKRMRDLLDEWQAEVREPLTQWEWNEENRKAKHQAAVDQISLRIECADLDSAELKTHIAWLEALAVDERWEEYETEGRRAKDKALSALREALIVREKYEAEQAELTRLRAEAAEREQREREAKIAQEAEERARREVEEKARREREEAIRREHEVKAAAERRELELRLQAEQAEREKIEAQRRAEQAEHEAAELARAAAAAERQRQADEIARIKHEAEQRERDTAHKRAVNREAVSAFIEEGLPEDCAKLAVTLIAKKKIPHLTIVY